MWMSCGLAGLDSSFLCLTSMRRQWNACRVDGHVHTRLCPSTTSQLRQLQHRRLTTHRQLMKNPGDQHLRQLFSNLRKEASQPSRSLRKFNDFLRRQCGQYHKQPRKRCGSASWSTKSLVVTPSNLYPRRTWVIWVITLPKLCTILTALHSCQLSAAVQASRQDHPSNFEETPPVWTSSQPWP